MISEFQELADKIAKLAELTTQLRNENAMLRKSNDVLIQDALADNNRLKEAQRRIEALLAQLPPAPAAAVAHQESTP